LRFFFDTSISSRLVRALKIIVELQRIEITHLNDRFDESSVPDEQWIKELAGEGDWIIVSADPRITRAKAERAAWKGSQLTAFFFADGWSSRTIYEQAADLIHRWPDIVQTARGCPKGSGFLITKSKSFQSIYV
jgi:hypothetical protein